MTQTLRAFDPERPAGPVRPQTVQELFDLYVKHEEKEQSARTFEERKRLLDLYAESYGVMPIADLIPADLELWLKGFPSWKSDWTLHRVVGTIQLPFNWGSRLGLIGRNPFLSVTHPTGERGKPIEQCDFQTLLRSTDALFRRVLAFQWWTGARPCEMAALEWSFIDTDEGTATLYIHKTAKSRKDRAPRIVYLPEPAVKLLVWIAKRQQPGERFVFLNSRGGPWNRGSLTLRIYRLRKRLGLSAIVRLYGIRHRWASRLAKAKVELKTLATLLGHTTARMAEHYVHMAGETDYLRDELRRGLGK